MGDVLSTKELGLYTFDVEVPEALFARRRWYQDWVESTLGMKARHECHLRSLLPFACFITFVIGVLTLLYGIILVVALPLLLLMGFGSMAWREVFSFWGLFRKRYHHKWRPVEETFPLGPNLWLKALQKLGLWWSEDYLLEQERIREATKKVRVQQRLETEYAALAEGQVPPQPGYVRLYLSYAALKARICRPFPTG